VFGKNRILSKPAAVHYQPSTSFGTPSPEFAAAVADAQRFLDLSKTYAIVVNEISVIGNSCGIGDREDR
jgi:hypothetical protein